MLYTLTPALTHIGFRLVLLGVLPLAGAFPHAQGTLTLDGAKAAGLEVQVATAGVQSPVPGLAGRLCGTPWLDCTANPVMRFVAASIGHAPGNGFVVRGTLLLHGRTHPLLLHARVLGRGAGGVTVDAEGAISRAAYGIGPSAAWLSDRVVLSLHAVFAAR